MEPTMNAAAEPMAAPLLSVVLPVHGVQEYLPACLDSVLGQPGPALEVIAVDDASPDSCGQILDERARWDPRLRVVHLAESGGPGQARNLGLAQAGGQYVWFIDPDDLAAGGALAAVAESLRRHDPDVLLLGYEILDRSGRTEPGPGSDLLREPPPVLTLADRPELLNRTMTVWSKIFRREFLTGLAVPFPPGIHEDVPVSCAALLAAKRIALLGRPCYVYRRRARSFLATPSVSHFSIFCSYEPVLAKLADAGDPRIARALFGRAIEHYSTVLASGLVPRRERRRFFQRLAADFRRYRPAGYRRPAGWRGMKIALIERDAYWLYRALAPLNKARVRLRHSPRQLPARSGRVK